MKGNIGAECSFMPGFIVMACYSVFILIMRRAKEFFTV